MDKEDVIESLFRALAKLAAASILYHNGTLGKWVGDEWIIKPAVGLKDLRHVWLEDADLSQVDLRYYHSDGRRRTKEELNAMKEQRQREAVEKKQAEDAAFLIAYQLNPPPASKFYTHPGEISISELKSLP